MAAASKPITQEPMRSISWRAGCSQRAEELRLGDGHAQHRHLQPREPDADAEDGIRSSARMLWNISATISIVAFSVEVGAFFLSSPVRRRRSTATSWTAASS